MTAFAKWTMAGEALFGDVSARQGALEQRQQLCTGAGAWRPQTLKTNINALALMYKQTAPPTGIVPSVDKQFPKFCRFFNAASKKKEEREKKREKKNKKKKERKKGETIRLENQ